MISFEQFLLAFPDLRLPLDLDPFNFLFGKLCLRIDITHVVLLVIVFWQLYAHILRYHWWCRLLSICFIHGSLGALEEITSRSLLKHITLIAAKSTSLHIIHSLFEQIKINLQVFVEYFQFLPRLLQTFNNIFLCDLRNILKFLFVRITISLNSDLI